MNAAEKKLDLFRKIDSLKDPDLEKIYTKFIALLSTTGRYHLSKDEEAAIDLALENGKDAPKYTHDNVMKEAKDKYSNLNFK